MAGNSPFEYLTKRTAGDTEEVSDRLGAIEEKLGIAPVTALGSFFGGGQPKATGEKKGSGFKAAIRDIKKIGALPVKEIQKTEEVTKESAADYAQFLAGQVSRGEKSPVEASDVYADFGLAYNIPDAFKTAQQLGTLKAGLAPEGTVEKYRPFQEFAARSLGIGLTEEDIKSTEAAARALGKTSPEAFSQFLGQKMLSSPEYVRKNPLAFAANLPYGGKYGVGYQTPGGTFTGTYRFNPSSTVNYN